MLVFSVIACEIFNFIWILQPLKKKILNYIKTLWGGKNAFDLEEKHVCQHVSRSSSQAYVRTRCSALSQTRCKHVHLSILLILSNWKLIQWPSREIDKELMKGKRESLKAIRREVMMASVADMEMGKWDGAFFFFFFIKIRTICKLFIQSYIKMCFIPICIYFIRSKCIIVC